MPISLPPRTDIDRRESRVEQSRTLINDVARLSLSCRQSQFTKGVHMHKPAHTLTLGDTFMGSYRHTKKLVMHG